MASQLGPPLPDRGRPDTTAFNSWPATGAGGRSKDEMTGTEERRAGNQGRKWGSQVRRLGYFKYQNPNFQIKVRELRFD